MTINCGIFVITTFISGSQHSFVLNVRKAREGQKNIQKRVQIEIDGERDTEMK